uniref:Ion_trans domain-containing protein n=1 Tax=Bursaphelenchus xylophilus TaxID=6326 RepID=A0A1I7RMN9_BURXY
MKWAKSANSIYHVLFDFCQWTSIHGAAHVAQADKVAIAVFWVLVTLAMFGIMAYLIVNSILNFLSYPVTMTQRVDAYNAGKTNATYGFTSPFSMAESMRATRWTRLMYEELRSLEEDSGIDLSYKLSEMLIDCKYNQADCDLSGNVTSFYDPYNGLCHTINSNMSWASSRAGPYNGLRISLKSPTEAYLPWVQTAGVIFYAHGTDETPFQDTFGYFAQTGKCSSVGLRYMERVKLPHPYNDCSKNGHGAANYYSNQYEVEACLRSCLQDNIMKICGCYDPQYNYPSNVSVPSCYKMPDINEAIDCADSIINEVDESSNTSITECNCPFGCDESFYQIAMSQAKWPATTYMPPECANITANWNNKSECVEWYKANTLMLEIYLERSSYQSNLESVGYTLTNMIADVGGQLGLWLGMSVLSLFELCALGFLVVLFFIVRPEPVTIGKYDYFAQFNKQIAEQGTSLIYRSPSEKNEEILKDINIAPPKIAEAQPVPGASFK